MLSYFLLMVIAIGMLAFGLFRLIRGSRKIGQFIKRSKSKKVQR